MSKGYHIVLEGPDASGKKTQSELLVAWLNKGILAEGKRAIRHAYPRYETPYGILISEYLAGKTGSQDPYFASTLYAGDRKGDVPNIIAELEDGHWVICDRYVESNRAHQVARVADAKARQELADYILHMEYEVLGIPRANLTILLNVPYEVCYQKAVERQKAESGGVDIHEDDKNHLRLAWEQYQELAGAEGWPIVNCAPKGALLPREEIMELIQVIVREKFQV